MRIAGICIMAVFVLPADAAIVHLDLLTLGCQTTYDPDSTEWTADFDLGITFSQISHVYIDWSGEIIGGLGQKYDLQSGEPVGDPFPLPSGIYAYMGSNPYLRNADMFGGVATYPNPEFFDQLSEIELLVPSTWSDLLDGTGKIYIGYQETILWDNEHYIEHGSVTLDKAVLVVDGTVVPEPASISLLALGGIGIRLRKLRRLY